MSNAEPRNRLSIRSKYRGPCFRAIETVLREDPVLVDVVKTWKSRQGLDTDAQAPGYDMFPMIALSPVPVDNTVFGVDETKINFMVSVDCFVEGTCVDDAMALWEAVEDAIVDDKPFRSGMNVRQYLCSVLDSSIQGPRGVMLLRPQTPAFSEFRFRPRQGEDEGPVMQRGSGSLVCFLSRPK